MTKQITRKTLMLFMILSVFMTTICSQTSVKAANKVYKNVKLIFEDNQGNTIKTFTKDIVQGETLGQILGDQYPTMKADSKLGNFTGWYSSDCLYGLYSGKRYEKNTSVNIEYDYEEDDYIQISFKAVYEKKSVRITYYYMDNTGWHEKDEESILTPGTGKNAILSCAPAVGDVKPYCHFENWKIVYGEDVIDDNPDQYYLVEAAYDNYQVGVKKSYIDNTGNVKTVKETKYYPAGSKYEDILVELKATPDDASTDTTITGWNIFDPYGYTDEEGTIGVHIDERGACENDFDLIAEYQNVELNKVFYKIVGEDQKIHETDKVVSNAKNSSDQDVYNEAIKYIPDGHMKALEYTGNWYITRITSDMNDDVYYSMMPKYNKIVVEVDMANYDHSVDTIIYAADPGDTLDIPDGYFMTAYDEAGNTSFVTKYTVPKDAKEHVYVTWFSKKFLEDNSLADKINNAKDGEIVEDTLSKDGIVSKAALNALKGREVSLVLSIADQNAKWIINGASVNDVSDDINLSVTRSSIDTGNISYDKISKLLSKRQAEQIAFGNSDKFNFTGKLEVSTSGLGGQDKAVLIQKSDSDNMEYTNSAKINDASTTFTVDNGHDGVIIYGMNGDTNADSKIDIRDAMECLRHVSGREDIDVVKQGFADVNFDDKVNVQDLIKEIHVVSGREDTF